MRLSASVADQRIEMCDRTRPADPGPAVVNEPRLAGSTPASTSGPDHCKARR